MTSDIKSNQDSFNGFSKLNRDQRYSRLQQLGIISADDISYLSANSLPSLELAEKFIENVIGYFPLPLGLAVNFNIDGKDYVIPMAVEETSIVAAASKTARWVCEQGEITTEMVGDLSIGQIQIAQVKNFAKLQEIIEQQQLSLIAEVNKQVAQGMVARGGGVKALQLRKVTRHDHSDMAVIHVLVNTCDAMGANIINQICEYLKHPIEKLSGETVTMCILSNLNDAKLTRAKVIIRNIEPELGNKIAEASMFAECDSYRAATSNKGVLNGMDPILVATGNDWRAIEAGVHAHACRDGQYRSITRWFMQGKDLIGILEAPIMVGIVGGVTTLHPTATLCLKILNITKSDELARVVAAAGLIQNLGAIRALTTVGIIEGHMKLHIDNLTLGAGAQESEIPLLKQRLVEHLKQTKRISLHNAIEILAEIRSGNSRTSI